ncbi:MAG: T9SS type A sorting domain-containing protein [Anaerolineae bacterium]|nr:T9SS type A sorting domain-containing protein [Anaerolineae bacterium]
MKRQKLFSVAILMLLSLCSIAPYAFGQVSNYKQLLGLPPGFDGEIVVDASQGLALPHHLDFDSQGNLYISSANPSAPIIKVASDGSLTFSSTLPDPDGVAVDVQDNVFAAGGDRVTLVQSFTGGGDSPFASGFSNLDAIAIDSEGNLAVLDNEFFVKKILRSTGATQLLYSVSGSGGTSDVEFNSNDELFITANTPGQLIKIDASGNADIIIPSSPVMDPGFGAMEFGPGGGFGNGLFIIRTIGSVNSIEILGSNGQLQTFAQPAIAIGGLAFSPSGDLYVSELATPGRIFRIFPAVAPDCVTPPSGMTGWWPGEDNANDTQSGNHGTLQNGATFAPGLVGQAFIFDGVNNYVSLPPNSVTGDFTVEFWEKSSSNALYRVALSFAASASPATSNLIFDFNDPDWPGGTGLWVYWNGGGEHRITTGSIGSFTNGIWHHIALTRSGTNMTLYVNGVSVGSTVYVPAIDLSNFNINHIGAGPSPGNFWDGLIDEATIYNRALTASEIQSIYNAGSAGKCKECTPPEVSITGNDPVFTGTTPTYSVTTNANSPSFEWSVTGGMINGSNTNSSVSITAGAVGTMMVSVNVTDGVTNCSKEETKDVTVNPPPAGSNEVVFATNSVWLKEHAKVLSGNVIVNNVSSGPVLDSQVELTVGHKVTTPTGFSLKANRIKVKQGAVVESDVFYNALMNNGAINGSQNSPLTLPVFASLPAFKQAPPGTQDITVNKDESITLTAGAYRDILIKQNGTILFTGGGTFALRSLNTGDKAKLLFNAPTEIIIEGKLDTDQNSYVGPQSGSGVGAADIIFYIAGINGNSGNFGATPKAAQLGLKNTILANFYIPNGTLWMREHTVATGAFLGRDVIIGENAQVTMESAFSGGSSLANARVSSQDTDDAETSFPLNIVKDYGLEQNYPNPFNPSTMISFALPENGKVTLRVFTLTGQLVRQVASGDYASGRHEVIWDGKDDRGAAVASGVYFCQIVVQKENGGAAFTETRRMTLVK